MPHRFTNIGGMCQPECQAFLENVGVGDRNAVLHTCRQRLHAEQNVVVIDARNGRHEHVKRQWFLLCIIRGISPLAHKILPQSVFIKISILADLNRILSEDLYLQKIYTCIEDFSLFSKSVMED